LTLTRKKRTVDSTKARKPQLQQIFISQTVLHKEITFGFTLFCSDNNMPKCCIICSAEASQDMVLQYCAVCQSALYCSKACQIKDWKMQHKQICKLLNVGHGDMQVRADIHTRLSMGSKEQFEDGERLLDKDTKEFFKLFRESTFEESEAAARKMKRIAEGLINKIHNFMWFHTFRVLARSDSEMLSWPNSPLHVLLQLVDPNVLSGDEDLPLAEGETRQTMLHYLTYLADPFDFSTHRNQLILAKQLIMNGANVNAVSNPIDVTPLHRACSSGIVTNLDFVELLLKKGANPNVQDHLGRTPLMYTTPNAPGAAKFLLTWPTTDANITTRCGISFLFSVRCALKYYADEVASPDSTNQVQHQFLLQQWREIEAMVVGMGAADTRITPIE
jgi:hypothetical protein